MSNSTIALQSAGQVTTVVIGDITYHFAITQLIAVTVAEQENFVQIRAVRRNDWGSLLQDQFNRLGRDSSYSIMLDRGEFSRLVDELSNSNPLRPLALSKWLHEIANSTRVA